MIQTTLQVVRASGLLAPQGPAQPRLDACWNDQWPGVWFLDDVSSPTALVLVDPTATITWSGTPTVSDVQFVVDATLARCGEAMIGLHPRDERATLVPPTHSYCGEVLDYIGRRTQSEPSANTDVRIVDINDIGWQRAHHVDWRNAVHEHGAVEPFGQFVMDGDDVIAEAIAVPCGSKIVELGVWVEPNDRRRGLATLIATYVVDEAEARGLVPFWNTNSANTASIRLAERLGFSDPTTYTLWAWP